jgi:cytochrome P450
MNNATLPIPQADAELGLQVLQAFRHEKSPLAALRVMRDNLGDIFQVTLPGFRPVFLSGPEYSRFVLVDGRQNFLWRSEGDPVTRLLRHGLLVEDGASHDQLRAPMNDILSGKRASDHIETFWRSTDAVSLVWQNGQTVDMLEEMRKAALLIFMKSLLAVDFQADMEKLWQPILRLLKYISPGLWIIAPNLPRPGYQKAIRTMDAYLLQLIIERRANPIDSQDLLSRLVSIPEFDNNLIRDQLLTMLIAGHDTSTALLAWTLYLLGSHRDALARAQAEADLSLQGSTPTEKTPAELPFLETVIKESLRLYPPIHVGNRRAAKDIPIGDFTIPARTRVMYSIYLTQRDPKYWPEPDRFIPARFERSSGAKPAPFSYIPFGGGPRTCIGAAFAQVEAKIVLARLLSNFDLTLVNPNVRPYMGATLEPRPGVMMRVQRRKTT